MDREQLKGHLDLLILAVLSHGADHGYAVITSLRDASDGRFDLPEGTVYPALHRLERTGALRSSWAAGSTRPRRVYELTGAGYAALAERQRSWDDFASGVRAVLGWTA